MNLTTITCRYCENDKHTSLYHDENIHDHEPHLGAVEGCLACDEQVRRLQEEAAK